MKKLLLIIIIAAFAGCAKEEQSAKVCWKCDVISRNAGTVLRQERVCLYPDERPEFKDSDGNALQSRCEKD